jgi:hypothetical protein
MTTAELILKRETGPSLTVALTTLELEVVRSELVGRGVLVGAILLRESDGEDEFLRLLAHAANFPFWFGSSWEGVDACLRNPEAFGKTNGLVLLVAGETSSQRSSLTRLEDAVAGAAPAWSAAGRILRLIEARS